jgi:hypothetical protein
MPSRAGNDVSVDAPLDRPRRSRQRQLASSPCHDGRLARDIRSSTFAPTRARPPRSGGCRGGRSRSLVSSSVRALPVKKRRPRR